VSGEREGRGAHPGGGVGGGGEARRPIPPRIFPCRLLGSPTTDRSMKRWAEAARGPEALAFFTAEGADEPAALVLFASVCGYGLEVSLDAATGLVTSRWRVWETARWCGRRLESK